MCSMEFYTGTLTRTSIVQLQSHPGKIILMGHAEEACSSVWTFVSFPHLLHLQRRALTIIFMCTNSCIFCHLQSLSQTVNWTVFGNVKCLRVSGHGSFSFSITNFVFED